MRDVILTQRYAATCPINSCERCPSPPLLTELPYRPDSAVAVRGDRRPAVGGFPRQRRCTIPAQSRLRHPRGAAVRAARHARQPHRNPRRRRRAHARGSFRARAPLRRSRSRVRAGRCRSAAARSAISATISRAASSGCRRARTTRSASPRWRSASTTGPSSSITLERRTWLVGQGRDPETDIKWDALVRLFSEPPRERQRAPFRDHLAGRVQPDARDLRARLSTASSATSPTATAIRSISRSASARRPRAIRGSRTRRCASSTRRRSRPISARRMRRCFRRRPSASCKVDDGRVETKPIKGTRPRAGHARLDAELAEALAHEREGPRRERDDRRSPAQRSFEELPARLGEGAAALRRRELRHRASSRQHRDGRARARPRRDRSPARLRFPAARSPARRSFARCRSSKSSSRIGAACTAARSATSASTATWISTSRSARSSCRAARSASGRAAASSPIRQLEDEYQETFDKAAAMLKLLQQSASRTRARSTECSARIVPLAPALAAQQLASSTAS